MGIGEGVDLSVDLFSPRDDATSSTGDSFFLVKSSSALVAGM
jgi:hypothetical protein